MAKEIKLTKKYKVYIIEIYQKLYVSICIKGILMSYRNYLLPLSCTLSLLGCGSGSESISEPIIVNTATADTTPPQIEIVGDNPLTLMYGDLYIDAGASALDNIDGAIEVTIFGDVNTEKIGTYTVNYKATDEAGNISEALREVIVLDIKLEDIIDDSNLLDCLRSNELNTASEVKSIDCADKYITSTVGIQHLKNLEIIELTSNNITEIDTSRNTKLKSLKVENNELTSVSLDENIFLESLYLGGNNLKSLDVSKNVNLEYFSSWGVWRYAQIHNFSFVKNKRLKYVDIQNNDITNVDLSNNVELEYLNLSFNNISSELDLRNNTNLKSLVIRDNHLVEMVNIEENIYLESLDLWGNDIVNIDVKENVRLKELNLGDNRVDGINLSENINLESVYLYDNYISNIDLSNNVKLKKADLTWNNLKSINLERNIELESITLKNNSIEKIDLIKNVRLSYLELDLDVLCAGEKCSLRNK